MITARSVEILAHNLDIESRHITNPEDKARLAVALLRTVRNLLNEAPRAQAKVRLALTSTEGAVRHAHLAPYRAEAAIAKALGGPKGDQT